MASITFFIQSKNNPAGIYIRIRDGRTIDAKAKTKFSIDPGNWSAAKGQPKNLKDIALKNLNQKLIELKIALLTQYNKAVSANHFIDTQWLKDYINPPAMEGAVPEKLVDYFTYYSLHKKSTVELATWKKLQVIKHLLERFEKEMKRSYFIMDVNADFKLKFEAYCQKQNYAANTIARAIKFIKTICNHAKANGIEIHFQLSGLACKMEKGTKVFLYPDEIKKILEKNLEQDYLDNARDWLIISCETGQRVSDFMRFTKDMIRYEEDVPLIEFTQVKTDKVMAVPLSKTVRSILKKRDGDFPRRISDQRYNKYIKDVCRLAGLTEKISGSKFNNETKRKQTGKFQKYELVTSHIGRRSFSTNYYGIIPTSLLINVTGHTRESSFLEYIGKTVTEKAIQLAKYF